MLEIKDLKKEQVDKMWDSELLALLVASLMGKEVNTEMPDFVFERLEKILKFLNVSERYH